MRKFGEFFANTISFILNPLLMPFYSIAALFSYTSFGQIYLNQILRFLLPVLLFSTLIPGLFIIVLKRLKIVSDSSLPLHSDRILPYLMVCFANGVLLYHFYTANMYIWFIGVLAVPVIVSFIGLVINFFWRISAHMLAVGALIGTIMSVCYNIKGLNPFVLFIILFILAGCLAVSRLYLNKCNAAQVYAGFFVGLISSFLIIWINIYMNYQT